MEGGEVRWNLEISPQERTVAIAKLQRFLAIIVGEGPEAAAKAADLAQKFEQHVYSSTTTKEEYTRVIISRIHQVQQQKQQQQQQQQQQQHQTPLRKQLPSEEAFGPITPRGQPVSQSLLQSASQSVSSSMPQPPPNGTSLADEDKLLVRDKVERVIMLMPKINLAINCAPNSSNEKAYKDSLCKLASLKGLIEQQNELLTRDIFIINPSTATTILIEIRKLLRLLIPPEIGGIDGAMSQLNLLERRLLGWLRDRPLYKSKEPSLQRRIRVSTDSNLSSDQRNVIDSYLKLELDYLRKSHATELSLIWRRRTWGYEFTFYLNSCKLNKTAGLVVEFPQIYPSTTKIFITAAQGSDDSLDVNQFLTDYERDTLRIFPPFTITVLFKTFKFYLERTRKSANIGASAIMDRNNVDNHYHRLK